MEITKVEIIKPEIPENWDYELEDKKFDELIYGWRRLTTDVVSDLWIFYNKLKVQGERRDLSENSDKLPAWLEWLESKGISDKTPLNHFKKLGWIEGKPIVSLFTGNNEWYTPGEYVELARKAMGKIDLDPASCDEAQKIIKAKKYYTIEDNGLEQEWEGNIWLNPPYSGKEIIEFIDKLIEELPNIEQAIILTNDNTDTSWFHKLVKVSSALCLLNGRVKFYNKNEKSAPTNGQTFFYIGPNIGKFNTEFRNIGIIMTKYD